jgi:hypothetical protein
VTRFFDSRPELQHVRDFARARRTCPWSTLGVVLVRAVCQIPYWKAIPPRVGGRMSLNSFLALVGPPAGGKGGSTAAGREAVMFLDPYTAHPSETMELALGSGEGIAKTFLGSGEDAVHTALFMVSEVDTLTNLGRRQGSTLDAELRKMWAGEELGFANAQKDTRTRVERHTYRAGLIVGVQPGRAENLLGAADGGTPQRFLWMPVLDPEMPQVAPPPLSALEVKLPTWRKGDLEIPQAAYDAIDAHQLAMHRGEGVDPLDGHSLVTRLKVAAGLMVLDGRQEMNEDDWTLARSIMAMSDSTRATVQNALADKSRLANKARALAAVERDEYAQGRKFDAAKKAILARLERLPEGEHLARNDLRKKIRADHRDYFDAAIDDLVTAEMIYETPLKQGGKAYTCTPGTPVNDQVKQGCTPRTRVPATQIAGRPW